MKRNFMWYYTVIILTIGAIYNFKEFLVTDVELIWSVAIVIPIIIWLFRDSK